MFGGLRSRVVAARWLRRIILAKYAPEFYQHVGIQRFRHPETGNMVLFYSLPQEEQKRIHEQWQQRRAPHQMRMPREEWRGLMEEARREEREEDEAEAAAGRADRKEMAAELKRLKERGVDERLLKKERKRMQMEIESRRLRREQERTERAEAAVG